MIPAAPAPWSPGWMTGDAGADWPGMQIHNLDRLGEHARAWDALVDLCRLPSPFMRSWWVDNAAGGEPAILACCDDDGTLVGGAAFEVDRVGGLAGGVERVRCLGQGPLAPDHLDVVAIPARRREVLGAVGRWLREGDRIIDLDGLSEHCELPFLLDAPVIERVAAPYVALEEADPVDRLPGRLRSTVKRSGKRLARAGFEIRRVPPEDASGALARLFELHDSRWQEQSSFATGWDAFCSAAEAGMAAGEVVIHEITDGEVVIASELELVAHDRAAFYQAGRLTDHEYRGSGSVLKAEVLRWARSHGMVELDLLRGDEPYKQDWATAQRSIVRIRTGVGLRGRTAAAAANSWRRHAPALTSALARPRRS